MRSKLLVGLLLVAAGATRVLGAQALTGGGAPGLVLDPQVSQTLREQLSAGYDQRQAPRGILLRQTPDRPLVRQVPVVPDAIAPLAQSQRASRCPMPVVKMETRALVRMPVASVDSTRLEKMPVARSACVNPLEPK